MAPSKKKVKKGEKKVEETPDNTNQKSLEDMEARINKQMEELKDLMSLGLENILKVQNHEP